MQDEDSTRRSKSRGTGPLIAVVVIGGLMTVLFWANQVKSPSPQPAAEQVEPSTASQPPMVPAEELVEAPPFHATVDAASLPKTLSPKQFKDPDAVRAYRAAQRIPAVLAQQPCYCWCDRLGHGSLLDCHVTNHAAT